MTGRILPSIKPMSISSVSGSEDVAFALGALLGRPSISEVPEGTPLNRLMGNLRPPSGTGLPVSIPSSEFSPSCRRLATLVGVRDADVEGVKCEFVIPNPKLRAGGG